MAVRDLIIIGGGPSGLSAAIAAKRHELDYQVLEQGVLVNSIFRFPPQMVFFTTPELLEIGGLPFVSPYEKPTRLEALRYYRKVVDRFDLQIAFGETVLSVEKDAPAAMPNRGQESRGEASASVRAGGGPPAPVIEDEPTVFAVETRSARGVKRVRLARHVLFAIGYYDHPVMLGVPGEDLPHVQHYYSDPHPCYRQRVVIVGGGNSAAEAALEMHRAGASVTIVHRGPELKSTIKYWVRPDIDNRIKEGSNAARFNALIKEIRPTSVVVTGGAEQAGGAGRARGVDDAAREEEIPAEAVFLLTGYRADSDLMVRAGIELDARDAPVHHPDTFETNVPGLFVAGGAIAGVDTGTIFIENGRFHGEKIVEAIAHRLGEISD
jgi:thioredoxin reductase (NADPH)